jgi:hypothetical protein
MLEMDRLQRIGGGIHRVGVRFDPRVMQQPPQPSLSDRDVRASADQLGVVQLSSQERIGGGQACGFGRHPVISKDRCDRLPVRVEQHAPGVDEDCIDLATVQPRARAHEPDPRITWLAGGSLPV